MKPLNFKTRCVQPIALDIGHDSIKMLQLEIGNSGAGVIAADKVHMPPEAFGDESVRRTFVTEQVLRMLDNGSFRGREAVSCLPSDRLHITSLRLPESETDEIRQSLRKEMTQRFGLDPDRDMMDYLYAGAVRQAEEVKSELILFAVDHATVENHIEMLESAGLRPVAIDAIPCALFRSFERSLRRHEDRERTVVFVDIGSSTTTVVFGDRGEISFVKQIPIAGRRFNCEMAARLGVEVDEVERLREMVRRDKKNAELDPPTRQIVIDTISSIAEELAKEIALCLRYYTVTFRGVRVEKAFFTGGEAYESILINVLKRQLPVKVEVAEPLKGLDLSCGSAHIHFAGDRRSKLSEWAVAAGLGLKIANRTNTAQPAGMAL